MFRVLTVIIWIKQEFEKQKIETRKFDKTVTIFNKAVTLAKFLYIFVSHPILWWSIVTCVIAVTGKSKSNIVVISYQKILKLGDVVIEKGSLIFLLY